jgi:hypothetical protein
MAFQVGSACYPTEVAAAQAAASSQVGSIVNHSAAAYVVGVSNVTASSITYQFDPVGGGAPITLVSPYQPQPCNLLTLEDGVELGWLMVAVWVGVYAVMHIARVLRGETGDNYGNA